MKQKVRCPILKNNILWLGLSLHMNVILMGCHLNQAQSLESCPQAHKLLFFLTDAELNSCTGAYVFNQQFTPIFSSG